MQELGAACKNAKTGSRAELVPPTQQVALSSSIANSSSPTIADIALLATAVFVVSCPPFTQMDADSASRAVLVEPA